MYIIMCAAVVQPYMFVEITVVHYYRVLYILWTTLQRCYMDTSMTESSTYAIADLPSSFGMSRRSAL